MTLELALHAVDENTLLEAPTLVLEARLRHERALVLDHGVAAQKLLLQRELVDQLRLSNIDDVGVTGFLCTDASFETQRVAPISSLADKCLTTHQVEQDSCRHLCPVAHPCRRILVRRVLVLGVRIHSLHVFGHLDTASVLPLDTVPAKVKVLLKEDLRAAAPLKKVAQALLDLRVPANRLLMDEPRLLALQER